MKIHTCYKCKEPNLHFEWSDEAWKLHDSNCNLHICKKKPEVEQLIAPNATVFILKSKAIGEYYTGSSRSSKNFEDAKQFNREELLNKRAVFEEAYVIVDYHSLKS